MPRVKKYPLIRLLQWRRKNEVTVFFSSGLVVEVALPWVRSAKRARIVDGGGGLDPGNGKDVGSDTVALLPGRVLVRSDRGWVGDDREVFRG